MTYHQYYLNDDDQWIEIGTYDKFTDWATNVLASNLDVFDSSGAKVLSGIKYQDINWDEVNRYR